MIFSFRNNLGLLEKNLLISSSPHLLIFAFLLFFKKR